MGSASIVVIGSLNMDLVIQAHRMPQPGETVRGTTFSTVPGGKGANQAAAVARLGGSASMIGCVGRDEFGERLLESLRGFGVEVASVRTVERAPTGIAAILVDGRGENRIVVVPGANGLVDTTLLSSMEDEIGSAAIVVLQLEIPMEAVRTATHIAERHRVPVLLNPAPASPLDDSLMSQVDYLVLNETEAQGLTGIEPVDAETCHAAARSLRGRGPRVIVLTLGDRGAFVLAPDGILQVPAKRVEVVDTTAAGDAFVGGLAVAIVEGKSLEQAAAFACAAGSLAVTRLGAQASLPSRDEVQTFLIEPARSREIS